MITDIKTFIADAKKLYPDFSFEAYDDKVSVEEKFEFFKRLNSILKEKYGRGYFKANETEFEVPSDLPVSGVETLIIYSLYSAAKDSEVADYRAAVVQNESSPVIAVNSIIDEFFDEKVGNEATKYGYYIEEVIYSSNIPLESAVYLCYKVPYIIKFAYSYDIGEVEVSEIINLDSFKAQCKELLKKDSDAYADMCFAIYGLWTAEEFAEFAKSQSSRVRWNVAYDDCPIEILQELANDECEVVARAAKYALKNV